MQTTKNINMQLSINPTKNLKFRYYHVLTYAVQKYPISVKL